MTTEIDAPLVRVRARTESMHRLSKLKLLLGAAEYPEDTRASRPRTWGECKSRGLGVEEPCPYVSCGHHLALDVDDDNGSIKTNFPDRDPDEIPDTCSLAVVEKHPGGLTLEAVAALLNLHRERARQLESRICAQLASEPVVVAWGPGPLRCEPEDWRDSELCVESEAV